MNCCINLLVISTIDVMVLKRLASGILKTVHRRSTLLSRPSGVHINVLPVWVWFLRNQV